MKIAFMAYDRPNYFGGPITNARRLLPELQRRGHEIHAMIFYDYGDSPTARYLEKQGIQCHLLARPFYTETQIKWILKQLREIQPDIFVPNIFVSGWYAARWVQQAGIPSIAAFRSDDAYHWGMIHEFVVGDSEWAVAGLVCVSDYLKQKVEVLNPQNTKLCVIPSGVPVPSQQSSQTGTALKLVYVGRLVQQQKRINDVVEAIIRVLKLIPEATATIIGEGNQRGYLETLVNESGLSHRITFTGTIPSENLYQHLIQHHVLVLLSDYEGTPGAVMDGMACGLVPVCLDIPGGVRELVIQEKTGLLVSDRTQSFEKAIQQLCNNQQWRIKLATEARKHILQRYSLTIACDRWENLFYELLENRQPRFKIEVPKKFNLPTVRPGLDSQDYRQSLSGCLKQFAVRLKHKLQ